MVESSPEAMLEINEKGTILLANSAATEIFGWSHEELIGSNVNLIVGGEHAKEHSKYLARYLTTGEKRVMGKSRELPARKKDGTEFPIELGLTEVVLKDGHRVFCGECLFRRKSSLLSGLRESCLWRTFFLFLPFYPRIVRVLCVQALFEILRAKRLQRNG